MRRRDEVVIAGAAGGLDYRTVRRCYEGKEVHPIIRTAVVAAAEKLGFPVPGSVKEKNSSSIR